MSSKKFEKIPSRKIQALLPLKQLHKPGIGNQRNHFEAEILQKDIKHPLQLEGMLCFRTVSMTGYPQVRALCAFGEALSKVETFSFYV